jgi:Microtubule-binding calmodulin-regulated spectrin-associated
MDVLDCLNKSVFSNFIILFKNTGRQTFQGLYAFDSEGDVIKIYGGDRLPSILTDSVISTYYKYSSSQKAFSIITGNKAISIAVDAVELKQVPSYKR